MSLLDKLKEASTIPLTAIMDESEIFSNTFSAPTKVPMLNVALQGGLAGGVTSGITMFAGPSKHFKTLFAMILAKAYIELFPEAVIKFYDTEFGAGVQYFKNLGIPTSRVIHTPITSVEEMKYDIVNTLDAIERGDKVFFLVDSIGNMASRKETEDARDQKSVADMTRAKALKGLFRMITPHLVIKDIPFVCVNHTYKEMALFPKDIVSGGTGAYYNSNQIFIIGRQQEKGTKEEATKVVGYNFIINVEKSRWVREKSKIPINVTFDGGVNTWSGLLTIAQESGHVTNPSKGIYQRSGEPKKYREDDTNTKEFWEPIITDPTFNEWITEKFTLQNTNLLNDELTEEDVAEQFEKAAPKKKVGKEKK